MLIHHYKKSYYGNQDRWNVIWLWPDPGHLHFFTAWWEMDINHMGDCMVAPAYTINAIIRLLD